MVCIKPPDWGGVVFFVLLAELRPPSLVAVSIMRLKPIIALAMSLGVAAASAATPGVPEIVDITAGISFVQYTIGTQGTYSSSLGNGSIDAPDKLFWVNERNYGGLKSYYIEFDPGVPTTVFATIDFGSAVQHVYSSYDDLVNSQANYGNLNLTYDFVPHTGPELSSDCPSTPMAGMGECIWVSGNTVSFFFGAGSPGDGIRVLVTPVPEPSSFAMLGLGLAGMGVWLRRRRSV